MKHILICLFLIIELFSDNTREIFLGTINRADLVGKRVTVKGVIEAKGCDTTPCKILLKRKIKGAMVIMSLTFQDKYQPLVNKKWIATPVIATCVYQTPFIYTECIN